MKATGDNRQKENFQTFLRPASHERDYGTARMIQRKTVA